MFVALQSLSHLDLGVFADKNNTMKSYLFKNNDVNFINKSKIKQMNNIKHRNAKAVHGRNM